MPQLVVQRTKENWQDRTRDYIVVVDGKEAARIGNGAEVKIEVDPGVHSVHLNIDWCHSPTIEFSISGDEASPF